MFFKLVGQSVLLPSGLYSVAVDVKLEGCKQRLVPLFISKKTTNIHGECTYFPDLFQRPHVFVSEAWIIADLFIQRVRSMCALTRLVRT